MTSPTTSSRRGISEELAIATRRGRGDDAVTQSLDRAMGAYRLKRVKGGAQQHGDDDDGRIDGFTHRRGERAGAEQDEHQRTQQPVAKLGGEDSCAARVRSFGPIRARRERASVDERPVAFGEGMATAERIILGRYGRVA